MGSITRLSPSESNFDKQLLNDLIHAQELLRGMVAIFTNLLLEVPSGHLRAALLHVERGTADYASRSGLTIPDRGDA